MVPKDYYDLLNDSSDRTRNIIYILVITSIVILIPFWNVRPDNWVDTRIEVRKDILRWQGWNRHLRTTLSLKDQIQFDRSRTAAAIFGLDVTNKLSNLDSINLESQILEFQKVKIQKSFISVPVFNVVIDINDLGLLGGFAFIVILSMLRASLWRELAVIKYIFGNSARDTDLTEVYQVTSMSQVLMTPPNPQLRKSSFWGYVNLSFLGLPLFVQAYSLWINFDGIYFGLTQNPSATYLVIFGSILALLLILFLTINCVRIVLASSSKWKEIARQIHYE